MQSSDKEIKFPTYDEFKGIINRKIHGKERTFGESHNVNIREFYDNFQKFYDSLKDSPNRELFLKVILETDPEVFYNFINNDQSFIQIYNIFGYRRPVLGCYY